ncbi:MAG: FecR domain-containing protein [Bryobacteraceae bacterium]|nr:FecR domain-containing protein [Bryobacteraceae bacterium]
MPEKDFNDIQFDELIESMRQEDVPAEVWTGARDRVWKQLAAQSQELQAAAPSAAESVCANFREQFAAYHDATLSGARKLLMEDHLGRCPACRRAFAQFEGRSPKVVAMPAATPSPARRFFSQPWAKWAIAASLALVGIYAGRDRIDTALAPGGPAATIASVDGQVFNLNGAALKPGAAVSAAEVLRTGPGSHARLSLADGSQVEVNERSQLAVLAAWSGQTISLERGDVIVEAAKQRRGRLRVVTRDAVASVKGTIFAVSSGVSGSLVGVVRGAVEVEHGGTVKTLAPGQRAVSSPNLEGVELREAVEWSQDRDKYLSLISELKVIERELARTLSPTNRTATRLLSRIPAQTVLYAALPNLGNTIDRAIDIIEQRARDNAALREWWESKGAAEMKSFLERVQTVTPMLGDEIVFVLAGADSWSQAYPLFMAEVRNGQQDSLLQALDGLLAGVEGGRFAREVVDGTLLVTKDAATLARAKASLGQGANSAFARDLAARYSRGVSWLWASDLENLSSRTDAETAAWLGVSKMRNVVIEMRSSAGQDLNEASLAFSGTRSGLASWIAAPAPAGSAEYVPTDALGAFSASTRDPKQVFDELASTVGKFDKGFEKAIGELEARGGINFSNDIAAAVGNDFTFALMPPALPLPGWFFAIEVYNPAGLNSAIEHIIEMSNRELAANKSNVKIALKREVVDGREWLSIDTGNELTKVTWTYDRGYMVMSTDRAIARKAIDTRNGGFPLIHSGLFRQELPPSSSVHQSAFLWVNTQGSLSSLAGLAPNPSIKSLLEDSRPTLVVIDGETERIRAVSRTRLTSLVLDMLASGTLKRTPPPAAKARAQVKL